MLRRTLLKVLPFIPTLAVVKPEIVEAFPKPEADFIKIPDWCPKGFLPMLGQKITPKQFPGLFESMKLMDRTFYPVFWKREFAIVEPLPIKEILNFREPKLDKDGKLIIEDNKVAYNVEQDVVCVTIIATESFRWPNGSLAPPGFQDKLRIAKAEFEKFYGPIKDSINE